jgi:hypothetical protein
MRAADSRTAAVRKRLRDIRNMLSKGRVRNEIPAELMLPFRYDIYRD